MRFFLIFILLFPGFSSGNSEIQVYFTEPVCSDYSYKFEVQTQSGRSINKTHGGFFCTQKDYPSGFDSLSGTVGVRIATSLKNSESDPIKNIEIADYILSDMSIAKYICLQFRSSPFELSIYTQNPGEKPSGIGIRPPVLAELSSCMKERLHLILIGCNVFTSKDCPRDKINTMHLKLIKIERRSGYAEEIASSGNLGRGIYANLEDWLFFTNAQQGDIHRCLWLTLRKLNFFNKESDKYDYSECKEKNAKQEDQLLLIPFDKEDFYSAFRKASSNANEITIVSMDFKDKKLFNIIDFSAGNGAKIHFIASSDWYYSYILKKEIGTANPDDISMALKIKNKYPERVTISFIENNFYFGSVGNTLHHKLALFRGGENTVITGTTNMNTGAINHNLDQAYIFHGESIVNEYSSYIDRINFRSIPLNEMPTVLPELSVGDIQR
ncbi:conserved hypothetical protein [Klebsiella variicola]|nr:conserved hypothetical protein [Klebsiella variicola]